MNKLNCFFTKILMSASILLMFSVVHAEKYAGEIFKMGSGIRNIAMGRTGITDNESSSKAYWNASLLALQEKSYLEVMHAEEFGGNLQYDVISANIGNQSNVGFVITRIGIDNIKLTEVPENDSLPSNDNRPFTYKKVNNADYIAYLGIGRHITDKLLIGISPKIVYRNIAEESCYGFGADLSSAWLLNDHLTLGARLRDFFSTQMYYENGTHEIVNPGLDLESSVLFNVPKLNNPVKLFINSEINFESMDEAASVSAGMMSFDWHAGLDLRVNQSINIYTGYDIDNLSAGFTFNYRKIDINYSFEQDTELENSHRMSVGIKL